MRKVWSVILCLSLLVTLFAAFTVPAGAEVEVTVGQEFAYNDMSNSQEDKTAWRESNTSPDGCWQYLFYSLVKEIYQPMKLFGLGPYYSFNGSAANGTSGLDYAHVRNYGASFHPATEADVCKAFVCPAAGHLTVRTSIRRANEYSEGSGTPTGIAIWLGKETQIYPTDGSAYAMITSTTATEFSVEADVAKGETIYIRINSIDANCNSDEVYMDNYIVYSSVDLNGDEVTDTGDAVITFTHDHVDQPTVNDSQGGGKTTPRTPASESSSTWWVWVIVAVVVVGGAVVAVMVVKKKKQ